MRYYDIQINNMDGTSYRRYTSFANNVTNSSALQVEFDLPVVPYDTPAGASLIKVMGVSLQDISQATNMNPVDKTANGKTTTTYKTIKIFGGMQKGLPLANPAQSGLLVSGIVQQAFGNWIGTDMSLNILLNTGASPDNTPQNLIVNWPAGTALATVIKNTLATVFPTYKVNINISSQLVLNSDQKGFYGSLTELAQYFQQISQAIVGGSYSGVKIIVKDSVFTVYDGTTPKTPTQIQFWDLIGQPTWLSPLTIQFICVMRADLQVGDYIKMPPTQFTTSPQSYSNFRDNSVQQGSFQIDMIRHIGNFRSPDAASWITLVDAHSVQN